MKNLAAQSIMGPKIELTQASGNLPSPLPWSDLFDFIKEGRFLTNHLAHTAGDIDCFSSDVVGLIGDQE
jgi:hypothetical protein